MSVLCAPASNFLLRPKGLGLLVNNRHGVHKMSAQYSGWMEMRQSVSFFVLFSERIHAGLCKVKYFTSVSLLWGQMLCFVEGEGGIKKYLAQHAQLWFCDASYLYFHFFFKWPQDSLRLHILMGGGGGGHAPRPLSFRSFSFEVVLMPVC